MNLTKKTDLDLLKQLPLNKLIFKANKIRQRHLGNKIELCSIINAKSGLCSEDCKFCTQSSRYSTNATVYPLKDQEQIIKTARQAKAIGAEKFGVVTSGNRVSNRELIIIARAIEKITYRIGIKVCASLGALEKRQLRILKSAGLCRYHHNIETSPHFYSQVVSTHSFEQRINTIKTAREVGLEVCSGGIVGMGESWQDRIEMAQLLKELDVSSVPLNFLVPMKGTPLERVKPILCADAIRTICIFRLILKDKIIKIAAGRETVLKHYQTLGFISGANGMLIGGYLTIRGNPVETDHKLLQEIKRRWTQKINFSEREKRIIF
jgi:biotin synthase